MKKRGFGKGYWNGFGGKIQSGDASIEAAAARELQEEAGLCNPVLHKQGQLYFSFGDQREIIAGHVFLCEQFTGIPTESEEMRPEWFDIKSIPYHQMWADDIYWLPYFLEGYRFTAYFHFDSNQNLIAQNMQIID